MPTVLIVDDDAALRDGMAEALGDLGHAVVPVADGETALARLAAPGIDAVLLDLRMPGLDGIEVLRRIQALPAPPPVAVLTAVSTVANTIEAMRLGAVDHLTKPVSRAELGQLIERMVPPVSSVAASPGGEAHELIGSSPAMREVQKAVGVLADRDVTVLLLGETGTGKEVVARAIHRHGRRAKGPFVAINCAAIPADLLESQLFGHVRGAFTGAVADRAGSFREAEDGTLFLDEIGDMAPAMQAKLLRVLQEREVTPIGGRSVRIDVRIIAATHRDLRQAVAEGRFREDLYYRLGVVPLRLPPLRERLSDILPLAEHFLAQATPDRPRQLSSEAGMRLIAHPWPGNVRELRNAMERVAALSRHQVVLAADLDFLSGGTADQATDWLSGDLPTALVRLEKAMIERALRQTDGNRTEAAKLLNIHRQLLYTKLARHGLEASEQRTADVPKPDALDGDPKR